MALELWDWFLSSPIITNKGTLFPILCFNTGAQREKMPKDATQEPRPLGLRWLLNGNYVGPSKPSKNIGKSDSPKPSKGKY